MFFFLNIFQACIQPFGQEMLSWVRLRGINAHSVSPPPPSPLASWYQFYCLVNKDTRALVAFPELLVRKLVDSGIEPATHRSTEPLTTQPPARFYGTKSNFMMLESNRTHYSHLAVYIKMFLPLVMFHAACESPLWPFVAVGNRQNMFKEKKSVNYPWAETVKDLSTLNCVYF